MFLLERVVPGDFGNVKVFSIYLLYLCPGMVVPEHVLPGDFVNGKMFLIDLLYLCREAVLTEPCPIGTYGR